MNHLIIKPVLQISVLLFTIFLFVGCSSEISLKEAHTETEKLFQKELTKDNIHNAFLHVHSPSRQIE